LGKAKAKLKANIKANIKANLPQSHREHRVSQRKAKAIDRDEGD